MTEQTQTGPGANSVDEFVRESVQRYRTKLLDLSSRNPLINFRHSERSRSHIRIVDEIPEILFSKMESGRELTFASIPDPELVPDDEKLPVFERALRTAKREEEKFKEEMALLGPNPSERKKRRVERRLRDHVRAEIGLPPFEPATDHRKRALEVGINPDYDLPEHNGQRARHFNDLRIQTRFFREELERKLGALRSSANVLRKDAGLNALYMAFGFLEYYESGLTEEKRIAPLVFYPVEIERELRHGEYRYFIRPTGDEIEVNVALAELLRQQLSLELPAWRDCEDGDDALAGYLAAVGDAISDRPDWKLRRYVTVGLFTFSTLAMYKDLDPTRWPETAPIEKHALVRTLIAGDAADSPPVAEDYDIDSPDCPDVLLVTDADSSQHSAVVDVLKGKNCVVQGPPGTGKSQTITNIISAALHAGRSVLFVAEKMAALEVVEKRLSAAGLQQFCLELHSSKTSKTAALGSLARRLEYRGPRLDIDLIRSTLKALETARQSLIFYVQKTSERAGQTGLTVHEILLGSAIRESTRGELPATLTGARFSEALAITTHQRQDMAAAARALESQLPPLARYGPLSDHPWRGLENCELTDFETDELASRVARWCTALGALVEDFAKLEQRTSSRLPQIPASVREICTAILDMEAPPGEVVESMLPRLASDAEFRGLSAAVSSLEAIAKSEGTLRSHFGEPRAAYSLGSARWQGALTTLSGLGLQEGCIEALENTLSEWKRNADDAKRGRAAAHQLAGMLEASRPSLETLRAALSGVALLQQLRRELWGMRTPTVLEGERAELLKESARRCATLRSRREELVGQADLSVLPGWESLRKQALALKSANWVSARFNEDCRSGRRTFRQAAPAGTKLPKRPVLAEQLLRWSRFLKDEEEFNGDEAIRSLLGEHFRGLDSPFAQMLELSDWAATTRAGLATWGNAGVKVLDLLFCGNVQRLDSLLAGAQTDSFAALSRVTSAASPCDADTLDDLANCEVERCELLAECLGMLNSCAPSNDFPLEALPSVIDTVEAIETAVRRVEGDKVVRGLLPAPPLDLLNQIPALQATLTHSKRIRAAELPGDMKTWLHGSPGRSSQLQEWANRLNLEATEEYEARTSFSELANLNASLWAGGPSLEAVPFSQLIARCQRAAGNVPALRDYISFLLAERAARQTGLGPVLDAYVHADQDYHSLGEAVELVFFRSAAEQTLNAAPKLKRLSGSTHEQLRLRYQRLDREYIELRRKLLASELVHWSVPEGNAVGRVSELTELALVRNCANQTRPRIPLRESFRRAGNAVRAMKPCWMMSPMSVAQFLGPAEPQFDLVVMDEASQIRPEEALGAILRGRQVVVVGDGMQLPPTNFFQKLSNDGAADDGEDDFQDAEGGSVLEAAAGRFYPARRLKWHYRSEHGSLIAFSNSEFYNNDLTIFPSPHRDDPEYGVRFVPVQGAYEESLNQEEAKSVVEHATTFMAEHPDRSLGIVAINKKQQDFIQEEMDRVFAADPRAEAYRAKWDRREGGLESFFVKNLENVQGDERDVIFISTVYGPDKLGAFKQRFGPINGEYGHRRLNVLFTRAKKQVVVFTSMDPESIQDEGKKRGVRVLREYLRYARSGRWAPPKLAKDSPDSEFERWVLDLLSVHGFEAVPQLGYAGYWIDIAVRHPERPATFICGIECDGASYHSARSVRERDRLRQEVLESHGWNIYRIWSTDWFRNPKLQTEKLVNHLTALCKSDTH